MSCTAKVTTCTETDEVMASPALTDAANDYRFCIPDGVAVIRCGDLLLRLDLHTLTCDEEVSHTASHWNGYVRAEWSDDTPGATPHEPWPWAKTLREDINRRAPGAPDDVADAIGALGRVLERHRPTGPDGKHGDRHTATCGCDTPRATPHRPDVEVSDAEVDAAWHAYCKVYEPGGIGDRHAMRAALVAAYEAREVEA